MPTPNIGPYRKLAYSYLSGMEARGEIHRGAADVAFNQLGDLGSPGRNLRRAIEFMGTRAADRLRNPEYGPDGDEMPLRAIVNRLVAGGVVRPESADGLVSAWALESGGAPAGLIGERVAAKLDARENWPHLVSPPSPPPAEAHVRTALAHFSDQLRPGLDRERLVSLWSKDQTIRGRPGHAIAAEVARRIKERPDLQGEDGFRVDPGDPIFRSPEPPPLPGNVRI